MPRPKNIAKLFHRRTTVDLPADVADAMREAAYDLAVAARQPTGGMYQRFIQAAIEEKLSRTRRVENGMPYWPKYPASVHVKKFARVEPEPIPQTPMADERHVIDQSWEEPLDETSEEELENERSEEELAAENDEEQII